MDSISQPPTNGSILEHLLAFSRSLTPFGKSADYYRLLSDQQKLKKRVEAVTETYKHHMVAYEKARRDFDTHVDAKQHSVWPALTHFDPFVISQDDQLRLSQLSVEVLAAQTNRDASEKEYILLVSEFNSQLMKAEQLKRRLGSPVIDVAADHYKMLETVQGQIRHENSTIDKLRADLDMTKSRYKGAMLRLEEVSNGVRLLESGEGSEEDTRGR